MNGENEEYQTDETPNDKKNSNNMESAGSEENMRPDMKKCDEPTAERTAETVEKEYEEKIKQLEDRYLRLAAEFDNYKKRTSRQFEDVVRNANETLLVQLLEVVDNFHRAIEAVPSGRRAEDFEALLKGMELIYQHFNELLKKAGVERIKAVGEKFDPSWHDAMMQIDSDKYPEGVVAQELSAGYKLHGKVIRHARVAVSRGKGGGAVEEAPAESE
jgi:molecular chaperone GrpE